MSCSQYPVFWGASLSEPHTSVTAFAEVVCMYVRGHLLNDKYFMKTKRPQVGMRRSSEG